MISFDFVKNYVSSFYSYVWVWVNYLFGRVSQTNKTMITDIIDVPKTVEEVKKSVEEINKDADKKKFEEDKEILKYLFPSFDFTKDNAFVKSDEMVDLLNKNITDLTSAKQLTDKVFYFSRMEKFPIYGIKKLMKEQLEEIIKEQKDELLLAILKNLDWEFSKPFFVKLFYNCKIFYYKLMYGRPLLEKIGLYEEHEVEINGVNEKRIVYNDVKTFFITIGRNEQESVNIRADCLDALLTYCEDMKKEATEVINSMGQLYTTNKDQTIYTNSQNVHSDSITLSCVASF